MESSKQCERIALVKERNLVGIPWLFHPSWAWATLTSLNHQRHDYDRQVSPYISFGPFICHISSTQHHIVGRVGCMPSPWQPCGIEMRSFCF